MEIEYVGLATVINSFWKKEVTSVLIEGNWFKQNMKKKFICIETTQIQPRHNYSI